MIKTFCDSCGVEILNTPVVVTGIIKKESLDVVIDTKLDNMTEGPNQIHICKYCILDAFARLDDRPKAR